LAGVAYPTTATPQTLALTIRIRIRHRLQIVAGAGMLAVRALLLLGLVALEPQLGDARHCCYGEGGEVRCKGCVRDEFRRVGVSPAAMSWMGDGSNIWFRLRAPPGATDGDRCGHWKQLRPRPARPSAGGCRLNPHSPHPEIQLKYSKAWLVSNRLFVFWHTQDGTVSGCNCRCRKVGVTLAAQLVAHRPDWAGDSWVPHQDHGILWC
jgi:hypothetical protein